MKKLFVILVLTALAGTTFGQRTESVFWKISGNGLTKSSYLFGTIHVASIALLNSFPEVMRIAKDCDFAIFESGGYAIGNTPKLAELHTPPLDSIFTADEYDLVDSFFISHSFGSIRPHNQDGDLLSMIQVTMMINEGNTQERPEIFDNLLHQKLIDHNKPTFHLDLPTASDEISNGLGYRILAEFLVYLIKDKPAFEDVVPPQSIDLDQYSKTMRTDMKLSEIAGEQLQKNAVKRNYLWLPKLEQKLREGSCFIAVGLLHLKYNEGLIKLLKGRGFTLTAVEL